MESVVPIFRDPREERRAEKEHTAILGAIQALRTAGYGDAGITEVLTKGFPMVLQDAETFLQEYGLRAAEHNLPWEGPEPQPDLSGHAAAPASPAPQFPDESLSQEEPAGEGHSLEPAVPVCRNPEEVRRGEIRHAAVLGAIQFLQMAGQGETGITEAVTREFPMPPREVRQYIEECSLRAAEHTLPWERPAFPTDSRGAPLGWPDLNLRSPLKVTPPGKPGGGRVVQPMVEITIRDPREARRGECEHAAMLAAVQAGRDLHLTDPAIASNMVRQFHMILPYAENYIAEYDLEAADHRLPWEHPDF